MRAGSRIVRSLIGRQLTARSTVPSCTQIIHEAFSAACDKEDYIHHTYLPVLPNISGRNQQRSFKDGKDLLKGVPGGVLA